MIATRWWQTARWSACGHRSPSSPTSWRPARRRTSVEDLALERGILREVIARAPAPMAVMLGDELVFSYVNEQALDCCPTVS